jgi:hypothetical protein
LTQDLQVTVDFNNPYMLGAFKRFTVQNEIEARWDYPIDVLISSRNKLFLKFDPAFLLQFQKDLLNNYFKGSLENASELDIQVARGDRLRGLTEQFSQKIQNFSKPELEKSSFHQQGGVRSGPRAADDSSEAQSGWGVILNLNHSGAPLYLVHSPHLTAKIHVDVSSCVHLKVKIYDPKVVDIAELGYHHPVILEPHVSSDSKHPNTSKRSAVKIIFCQLNEQAKKVKRFSSYLGIKGEHNKVIILKRRIQEL